MAFFFTSSLQLSFHQRDESVSSCRRNALSFPFLSSSHHGVALFDELVHIPARQGALKEHHDVFDHVLVRDVLEERRQRLLRLRLEEVELHHLSEPRYDVHTARRLTHMRVTLNLS